MPVPAAPRRAGPPRKKAAKPATPATPILGEGTVESPASTPALEPTTVSSDVVAVDNVIKAEAGDREEEIGEVSKAAVEPPISESDVPPKIEREEISEPGKSEVERSNVTSPKEEIDEVIKLDDEVSNEELTPPPVTTDPIVVEETEEETAIEPVHTSATKNEDSQDSLITDTSAETSKPEPTTIDPVASPDLPVEKLEESSSLKTPEPESSHEESSPSETVVASEAPEKTTVEEPAAQAEDEDEDEEAEAARRKRVAERLAKMGGINPFAPPQRKPSVSSEEAQPSAVSPIQKRASISRESVGSPPPPPQRKPSVSSEEQQSSATSPTIQKRASISRESVGSPPPPPVNDSLRRSSTDSQQGNVAQASAVPLPSSRKNSVESTIVQDASSKRTSHDGKY